PAPARTAASTGAEHLVFCQLVPTCTDRVSAEERNDQPRNLERSAAGWWQLHGLGEERLSGTRLMIAVRRSRW
ncbi:MAG TPA: hypothetical protein VIK60_11910, partial [Vicinamibacterales bacterium]